MKINCFEVGTDPSEDRMTHDAMRATHLTLVKSSQIFASLLNLAS